VALTVVRNACGVGTLIVSFVRISNGSLKMLCSRNPYANGARHVQPEPPRTFQTTARFNPALPSRTVGLDHSSRFPNGEVKRASLN
jgi:hypothetical protein